MEEQQNTPNPNLPPYMTPTEKPAFETGKRELWFCACILLCGLCLGNFILFGGFNLGFAIAACVTILISAVYLLTTGHRGTWYSGSILALCLLIAAGFGRSDDHFVKFVLACFLMVGVNLGLCLMAGQNRYAPGGVRSLLDAPRTLFRLGIGKLSPAFRGVTRVFREGSPLSRRSGAVLLGLVIAIPVISIVIPLLMSADAAFEGLLDLLPDFNLEELVMTAIFGGCLFCVLYTRCVALHHDKAAASTPVTGKKLNALTVNTALGAVCFVYLVYLLSQLAYFVGGFSGILPEGYTTAEYARRGFFEMAWLSAINLLVITCSVCLVTKQPGAPLFTRLECLFLGLVTEFLVVSATAKMLLYIHTFGLTRLRVLTMVILVFLGVTTALVSLWLFLPKLQYMKAVVLLALVLGAGVLWLDVDTQVARYNVSHYLSGDLAEVDVYYLSELGSGAVPYIARLANSGNATAREILSYYYLPDTDDFRGWNYTNSVASSYLP